jgi:uncharacterized membrane protein
MNLKRNRVLRQVSARPRLIIATSVAIGVAVLLPTDWASHLVTRLLIAWNVGTCLYVVLAASMMIRSSNRHMRHRAQLQDDGQLVILLLVVVASVASLVAIAGELAVVKEMHGLVRIGHITLAGVTVLSSWAFIQTMFAAVIGTSGQTADVSFVSKPMRRIGSVHCILAYLFNTTVLALLINIGASMF